MFLALFVIYLIWAIPAWLEACDDCYFAENGY